MSVEKVVKWVGIGIAIILLITAAFIVAASLSTEFREVSRDIAIVILAVFQMIASLLVIVLLITVLYAVKTINQLTRETVLPKIDTTIVKVDELLETTRVIAGNVRNSSDTATTTTVFVAEHVASPIIRASSLVAGVRAAAISLARRGQETEAKKDL